MPVAICQEDYDELKRQLNQAEVDGDCMAAEIERLRAAVRWALGEKPDGEGNWFGDLAPKDKVDYPRPYYWRSHLRKLAFDGEQAATEKRCVHGTPENQVCGICCGYK